MLSLFSISWHIQDLIKLIQKELCLQMNNGSLNEQINKISNDSCKYLMKSSHELWMSICNVNETYVPVL